MGRWFRGLKLLEKITVVLFALVIVFVIVAVSPAVKADFSLIKTDFLIYRTAAERLIQGQEIYDTGDWANVYNYRYSPAFAWLISGLNSMDVDVAFFLWTLAQIGLYALAVYLLLKYVRPRLEAGNAFGNMLVTTAIINSGWIAGISLGNISTIVLFLSITASVFFLRGNPWVALLLVPVAMTKPQWLFPMVIPLLKDWRLFLRAAAVLIAGYIAIHVLYVLLNPLGAEYGLRTIDTYRQFISHAYWEYPYLGPGAFTFEHGMTQTLYRMVGIQPWVPLVNWGIVIGLGLAFLAGMIGFIRARANLPEDMRFTLLFLLSMQAYLLGMLAVGEMQEIIAGFILYSALQAISLHRGWRHLVRFNLIFFLYALFAIPSYIAFVAPERLYPLISYTQWLPASMLVALVLFTSSALCYWKLIRQPNNPIQSA